MNNSFRTVAYFTLALGSEVACEHFNNSPVLNVFACVFVGIALASGMIGICAMFGKERANTYRGPRSQPVHDLRTPISARTG